MRRLAGLIIVVIGSFALHGSPLLAQARGVRELTSELRASDPEARARAACGLRELGDPAAAEASRPARRPDGRRHAGPPGRLREQPRLGR